MYVFFSPVILRRMSDHEKPLVLRLLWGGGDIRHNFSLQENETGDIVVSGKGLLCKLHCWEPVRSTNAVDKYFIFFSFFSTISLLQKLLFYPTWHQEYNLHVDVIPLSCLSQFFVSIIMASHNTLKQELVRNKN